MPVKRPLAEQLEELLNPAVCDADPEDIYLDDTRAQLVGADSEVVDLGEVSISSSERKLRRTAALRPLAELGPQYRGCTVKRSDLDADWSDADGHHVRSGERSDGEDDDGQDVSESLDCQSDQDDVVGDDDVMLEDSDADGNALDSASYHTSVGGKSEVEDVGVGCAAQSEGALPANDDLAKGDAIKSQMSVWDQLLECRIRLQSAVSGVQQLPRLENWQHFWQTANPGCQTTAELNDQLDGVRAEASRMLQQLYLLETKLTSVFPDTLDLSRRLEDCASTLSASDGVGVEDSSLPAGGLGAEGDSDLLQRRRLYCVHRDAVLQQWDDRLRALAPGPAASAAERRALSFGAFQHSPLLQQVEQLLADKQRLLQRTRTRRCQLHVLGQQQADGADTAGSRPAQEELQYDSELFDDSDFYHHLLRELIERKTASVTDPHTLGRHWVGAEKFRSNVKKKVDTRASKGRKVRYEVYPKLVNFMAASADNYDEQRQLARASVIASMFGRRCDVVRDPADVVNHMVTQSTW